MAYKRTRPMPIIEGGTNAISMTTTDGVIYYDGTKLITTTAGSAGQVLTSNGSGVAPSFQGAPSAGVTIFGAGSGIGQGANIAFSGVKNWFTPFRYDNALGPDTQVNNQWIVPVSGTIANLFVNVTLNGSAAPFTLTLNINQVNTALTTTISAGTLGVFSDTTHSVVVAAGDKLQFETSNGSTSTVQGLVSVTFTN